MTTIAERSPASRSSSQRIAGRSRWFVGSSSSRTSGSGARARTSAARLPSPPESCRGFPPRSGRVRRAAPRRHADRRSGRARPGHSRASWRSPRDRAPAADSAGSRPAAGSAFRRRSRSRRRRSAAASTCRSRCGRRGTGARRRRRKDRPDSSSGLPPSVRPTFWSVRRGGGAMGSDVCAPATRPARGLLSHSPRNATLERHRERRS